MLKRMFDGTDLEALQDHLRILTPGLRILPPPSRPQSYRLQSLLTEIGEVKAWRSVYSGGFTVTGLEDTDNFVIDIPTQGGLEAVRGRTDSASPGQLLSVLSREMKQLKIETNTRSDTLAVSVATLSARLAQLLDRPLRGNLQFQPIVETAQGGGAAVRCVLHGLLFAIEGDRQRRSTDAMRALSTAMIDLLLESLPHNHSEALHRPPPAAAPRQVRRALNYIRDNPKSPLNIDALAALCGVSVRSLQYSFRNFVGFTPSEYWRRTRLERAIQDIKREKPVNVAQIAASWGFNNSTRFRTLCVQAGVDLDAMF